MDIRRVIKKPKLPNLSDLPKLPNIASWVKNKSLTESLRKSMLVLQSGLAQEKEETKQMLQVYRKFTQGEATKEELKEANEQFVDVLRSLGLSVVVILPFSPITLPAIVTLGHKLGIDILPSAFREEKPDDTKADDIQGIDNKLDDLDELPLDAIGVETTMVTPESKEHFYNKCPSTEPGYESTLSDHLPPGPGHSDN